MTGPRRRSVVQAFGCGLAGVGIFSIFDFPLPWLLGPITACLAAALLGVSLAGIKPLNDTMRTILGVAVGATLTPSVVNALPSLWSTLILVPVMVFCVGLVGIPYFRRICGYDLPTAYYAAMPGGLQDMLAFGEDAGANVRALSLIHATRVTVIVVALPFVLGWVWQFDLNTPPGAPARELPVSELLIMAVCAIVGWRTANWLGLFGASILGPLILTATITLVGGLHHRPPAEAIWAAQFFIGMTVGAKYSGITMTEVRKDLFAGLVFCVILLALTLLFVQSIYGMSLASGIDSLLAFAPGGQAELAVLAIIVGADAAFVVCHHVLRIFTVILGAPFIMRLFSKT